MHQYWMEDGRFEIKEQHQACQVRSILKTKKLSEVETEALRRKVLTLQETVEVLIENDSVEGSDVTPVIVIGVEQHHPAAEGGMEGADELNQHYYTQRIRIMQENSCNPIPSLRGIDALKVKSTVSEINNIICNIRVKNLDELKNLLRAGARLVRKKKVLLPTKKNAKNRTGKVQLRMILLDPGKI